MVIEKNKKEQKFDKYVIHPDVQNLLIEQLSAELYNKLLYEHFANYFALEGYGDLERYYRHRANEEETHYQWIKKFLSDNDCEYDHPGVNDVEETIDNIVTPFELTVDVENETTELIYKIVEKTQEVKDFITYQWLMSDNESTGCLVKEQAEEMSVSRQALTLAQSEDSWILKAKAINSLLN